MPNPFEAFWNALKSSANQKQSPLHVGEVMACWMYLTAITEMLRYEEIGLNTTTDSDVKELLTDAYKLCESQADRLKKFLIKEGVPLPELSPQKPKTNAHEIPEGVKITDSELANGVSIKVAAAIVECASGQAQTIRSDVGILWAEFQSEMLTFSATLKQIMQKRGWLKIPPYYYPSAGKNMTS